MRDSAGYSIGPWVAVRVFQEDDHDGPHWSIDVVDAAGDFSEAVWDVYDGVRMSKATAIRVAPEFAFQYAEGQSDLPIQVLDEKTVITKRGKEWRVFIPPRGSHDFEGDAIKAPYGDSFWPTYAEACAFVEMVTKRSQGGTLA